MKYKNGMWMDKPGWNVQKPETVYEWKVENNILYLYAPFVKVLHRGNTLDGGMITLEISLHNGNVNFKTYHYKFYSNSKYKVKRPIEEIKVEEKEEIIYLEGASKTRLEISKNPFMINIFSGNKHIVEIPYRAFAYIQDLEGNKFMSAANTIDVNEKFYGLGERFTDFVKNGQVVRIDQQDGGTDSEQSYKNIPFIISPSKKYGIFLDHSDITEFEVASELVSRNQWSVEGQELRFDVIVGNNPKEVLSKFSKLQGDIPRLPEWSYGLWLSTSFTTKYDEETVLSFIDGMMQRDIPFEVFHFDCFWMKEYEWTNFEWNLEQFPNPKKLLKKIHDRGKKVCVWINPYIGQKAKVFDEVIKKGYAVKGENNNAWQWDRWQAGMVLIDFTNPKAYKWYQDKLQELIDQGVDTFKTDFGERIPHKESSFYETNNVEYFDGSNPVEMHNYYTYLYNKCVFEVLEKNFGKGEAIVFARSGTFGSGTLPVHWGGDCLSNYISMAQSLRGGLSLALSGFSYWSHDIGGFEAGCNPDIYKRWTQFGMLSSHSRYHGNEEYKVPWIYGDEAVEVTRKFGKLKNQMMPYIKSIEDEVVKKGLPFIRPMVLEFPDDPNTTYLDMQYMFGDKLLVAPIFNNKGIAKYYLPSGLKWYNILTNEVKSGGKWYEERFDYLHMPLLLKENECLVLKKEENTSTFDVKRDLKVIAFRLKEDKTFVVKSKGKNKTIKIGPEGIINNDGLSIELIFK